MYVNENCADCGFCYQCLFPNNKCRWCHMFLPTYWAKSAHDPCQNEALRKEPKRDKTEEEEEEEQEE